MLSVRTNPSTLAAGLGAVKNALRKLTDLRVNLAHPMYSESQVTTQSTKPNRSCWLTGRQDGTFCYYDLSFHLPITSYIPSDNSVTVLK